MIEIEDEEVATICFMVHCDKDVEITYESSVHKVIARDKS